MKSFRMTILNLVFGAICGFLASILFGIEDKLSAIFIMSLYWELAMAVCQLVIAISESESVAGEDEVTIIVGAVGWVALIGILSGIAMMRSDSVLTIATLILTIVLSMGMRGLAKKY